MQRLEGILSLAAALWLTGPPVRAAAAPEGAPQAVAATVGSEQITVAELNAAVQAALQGRPATPQTLVLLQAQLLEQLVDRKLVQGYLQRNELLASAGDVDRAFEEMKQKLAAQKVAIEDLLKQRSLTEDALRRQLAWELGWKAYVAKQTGDAELEAYFNANRKEFDGSEVAVSHILLRPEKSGDQSAGEKLVKKAAEIREQISLGKITFADAAKKYSDGPSRHVGGDVGFFPRQGVMLEPFARAAFDLQVGEISQPVVTRFGIHLIRVTKIKPGEKKWTDVREQLQAPLSQELLKKLAAEERPRADVKYTGLTPYLKPGTQQVVMPK